MDEYRQLPRELDPARVAPDAADARRREVWADELGDLLASGRLEQGAAERAVARLVQVAVADADHAVRESALHAVGEGCARHEIPYEVLVPLAVNVDAFAPQLLEYVLFSLSATHDRRALPPIEPFLAHPDPGVREEARLAVAELHASGSGSPPP
ncbi:hypothetical protein [Streptomyces sp. NPDC051214]|uniref:hypothetical protein n=1 Tax=Streptomyces sp. NPDC051214 TaxID=3155282 RepID=UPI003445BA48